jgi:hypothetical protein
MLARSGAALRRVGSGGGDSTSKGDRKAQYAKVKAARAKDSMWLEAWTTKVLSKRRLRVKTSPPLPPRVWRKDDVFPEGSWVDWTPPRGRRKATNLADLSDTEAPQVRSFAKLTRACARKCCDISAIGARTMPLILNSGGGAQLIRCVQITLMYICIPTWSKLDVKMLAALQYVLPEPLVRVLRFDPSANLNPFLFFFTPLLQPAAAPSATPL